jgi:phenylalanyl-tRNA synthetase beta chain
VDAWALGDPPAGPFHPGRSATILIGGKPAGVLGEIHPRVAASMEIEGRVAVCVLGLGALGGAANEGVTLRDIPRYPPVRRDLAFLVPAATPAGTVHGILRDAGGELVDASTLFDVYVGDRIPPGTKSLAFSLDLRARDRTLTDDEAQVVVDRIVGRLASEVDAQLRTGEVRGSEDAG